MTGDDEPRISCIIPTLNRARSLCDTIEMLLKQSYRAHEIIIVDQAKTPDEGTRRTLAAWDEMGSIRWLHQNEPNSSTARNAGALTANGDVLLFLDDDIQIGPEFVAAHARNYLDPKVVAVSGQVLENGKRVTTKLRDTPNDAEIGWIRFPKNYGKRCITSWVAAGNFSVRRNVYFEVGGMDENYKRGAFREETDFAMRFLRAGYRFQFDPAASIVHLGVRAVPKGGARSWSGLLQWHHCVGDWYFTLGFASRGNWYRLLWFSFRRFVASRYNCVRLWRLPVSAFCWLLSLPVALLLRIRGPNLLAVQRADR